MPQPWELNWGEPAAGSYPGATPEQSAAMDEADRAGKPFEIAVKDGEVQGDLPAAKPWEMAWETPAPVAPTPKTSLWSDVKNLFGIGVDTAAQDFRELARKVLPKSVISGIDSIDEWRTGKSSEALLKGEVERKQSALSPEQAAAGTKLWWDDKTGSFGDAWKDPRAYLGGVVESVPETLITMIPSMALAKGAYAVKLASEVGKGVAEDVAKRTAAASAAKAAYLTGAVGEGSLAGAQSSRQVRDEILAIPFDTLQKSDAYRALLQGGLAPEAARQSLADDASTKAFFLAGITTGIFGGAGDAFLARAFTRGVEGSFIGRVAKGMVSEGLLEEFPQSYLQQVSENIAKQSALPDTDLTAGALNQGLGGLTAGGVMGAGFGAVSRHAPPEQHPVTRILDAKTVDEAIAAATAALDVPVPTPLDLEDADTAARFNMAMPMGGLLASAGEASTAQPFNFTPEVQGEQRPDDREFQREAARLEPPAIELPGQPAAPTSIPPQTDLRRDYADALVKSQRGELLSPWEHYLLANPPETPGLILPEQRVASPAVEKQEVARVVTPAAPAQNIGHDAAPTSNLDSGQSPIHLAESSAKVASVVAPAASPQDVRLGSGQPQQQEAGARGLGDQTAAQVGPQFKDFTAPKAVPAKKILKGQVLTFKTERGADLYAKSNRLTGYKARESEGAWILSKPVLTRSEAQKANDKALSAERTKVRPRDSLATLMGKMGGLRLSDITSDGFDPKDAKLIASGVFGKPALRAKGGISLDAMAEIAAQHGFDVLDEEGRPDASKLRDLIDTMLEGRHVYTAEGHEYWAAKADEQAQERARAEALPDDAALDESGYNDLSAETQQVVAAAVEDYGDILAAMPEEIAQQEAISDEELAKWEAEDAWSSEPVEAAVAAGAGEGAQGREGSRAPPEVAEPTPTKTPATAGVSLSSIPPGILAKITVPVEQHHEGEGVKTVQVRADQALQDLDDEISAYEKLLGCVRA